MRKEKRALSLILVLCLCICLLAGCGGKKNTEDPASKNDEPEQTAAPEFVYVPEYISLSEKLENGIDRLYHCGDKFLFTSYGMIEDNTPEGVIPEYEGQYWVYGVKMYWMELDGTVTPMENYKPFSLPEMEGTEDNYETGNYTSAYLTSMATTPDGGIVTLDEVYHSEYNGPDDVEMYSDEWYAEGYYQYVTNTENYYIRFLAEDGSELRYFDLSDAIGASGNGSDYIYFMNMALDGAGNIYLLSDGTIYAVDQEGNLIGMVENENWIENIFTADDGRIGASYYTEDGIRIGFVDLQTGSFVDEVSCGGIDMYGTIVGGGEYDLYYNNGTNFFGYDFETGESTKILNWINSDVDTNNVNTNNIVVLEDGRILLLESAWNEETATVNNSLILMSEKPYSSLPQRKTLTYACQYLNYDVRGLIIDFNKKNPDYRIEIIDYSEYNTAEDYSAGQTKMTTEIMAGKLPDIIDLQGMPYDELAAKGLLVDIYPLIDSDPELSRDMFFDSVFSAAEYDGKLFSPISSFSLRTVIGAAAIVGDEPGWTFDEFNAALASMPEGCEPFDRGFTRDQALYQSLYYELNNLVDWKTGECRFNTPEFTDILTFAAQFPETFDWDNEEWTMEDETDARIAAGRQMLMQTTLYDFQSIQMYEAMFGGDITYIGYPTSSGIGNALEIGTGIGAGSFAITTKCSDIDAAWQFMRTLLTEKYQEKNVWNFPTNRAAFDSILERAMTPIWKTDEKGNYLLDENGNRIEESQGSWGWGNTIVEIKALTQEEADEVLDLINSTTRVMHYDEEILAVVNTEAAAFFAGQKSAEEVARLVQSKVNILVNEKR